MQPWKSLTIAAAGLAAAALWVGRRRQERASALLVDAIRRSIPRAKANEPASLAGLPPPVARYLDHVLPAEHKPIRCARYRQAGSLRIDARDSRWFDFTASQFFAPTACGFVWDARVSILPFVQLRVRDSLVNGRGSGQVALWSAITVASAAGEPQMNSGSLHRFLAEAVWCPSALMSSPDLHWQAIDDRRAIATLRQGEVSVSLEFRFNQDNEVTGIYTPGRWGSFEGGYRQVAWEGRFRDYERRDGVLVPGYGEVGWYIDGQWQAVWRGTVVRAELEFE